MLLGHGSGGNLSADLIRRVFLPEFGNPVLVGLEDQATLRLAAGPRERPQGSAVGLHDRFVRGPPAVFSRGRYRQPGRARHRERPGSGGSHATLSFGGLHPRGRPAHGRPAADRGLGAQACREAGVQLVTGDTKVVDHGKGDQVFITTSGIGIVPAGRKLSIRNARPGDQVLVSGTIGDHGIAIMSVREGLEFETVLESDSAPLHDLTRVMLDTCPEIRCMRDPTRGGVSSALNELAAASKVGVHLKETALPVRREVSAACEMLGLDPLYVANEGKLVAIVPPEHANQVLSVMRQYPLGQNATLIGEIVDEHPGMVVMRSVIGGDRVVTMLAGEQLPRIC